MSKVQGFRKDIVSTTLYIWRRDREKLELAWDGKDVLLYLNDKYLRKITDNPAIQIEVWDSEKAYLAGDNFVSYKSPDYQYLSDGNPFSEEYIYRCIENTNPGESPESHPDKWGRQGKVGQVGENTIFLSDVSGLEEELDERIKYDDLSEEFDVSLDKKVSLNIDYVTISDFSGKGYIQPSEDEVKIGDTIWKTANETWDDGGDGIYYPDNDPDKVSEYGLLYTWEAVQRLLEDNPDYRIPTHVSDRDFDYDILDTPLAGYNRILETTGSRFSFSFGSISYWWRKPGKVYNWGTAKPYFFYFYEYLGPDDSGGANVETFRTDVEIACSVRLVRDI